MESTISVKVAMEELYQVESKNYIQWNRRRLGPLTTNPKSRKPKRLAIWNSAQALLGKMLYQWSAVTLTLTLTEKYRPNFIITKI